MPRKSRGAPREMPSKPTKYLILDQEPADPPPPSDSGPSLNPSDEIDQLLADIPEGGTREEPEVPQEERVQPELTIFPTPPAFKMDWQQFYRYWQKVYGDPHTRKRLAVYVYRLFPAMLDEHRNMATLEGDSRDPDRDAKPMTLSDMLHRFGTGDYSIKMNDKGAGYKQVAQCTLLDRTDLRDWENHPPVLDHAGIDTADPVNKTYIQRMKQRGSWGSSEDEMSQALAIAREINKAHQSAPRPSAPAPSLGPKDFMEAIRMGREDAKTAVAAPQTIDPVRMMETMMTMLERARPSGDPNPEVARMVERAEQAAAEERRRADEARADQMRMLEATITRLAETQQAKAASPDDDNDPLSQLKKMAEMQEITRTLFGRSSAPKAEGTDWAAIIPAVAPALQSLVQSLANVAAAYAAKSGAQVSAPPPDAQQQPQQIQGGAPDLLSPELLNAPTGSTFSETFQDQTKAIAFLAQIRAPLFMYFNHPDRNGEDFADYIETWKSPEYLAEMAQVSADDLLQTIGSFPPIAEEFRGREILMRKFIEEFRAYGTAPPQEEVIQEETPAETAVAPNGHAQPPRAETDPPMSHATGPAPGPEPVETPRRASLTVPSHVATAVADSIVNRPTEVVEELPDSPVKRARATPKKAAKKAPAKATRKKAARK